MKRAIVLVALAACGRIGFGDRPGTDAGDAGFDAFVAQLCGSTALLADTFTGTTAGPQWFTYANGTITTMQSGGELVVTLPATTPGGSTYGGYDSAWAYDLRGSRVFVEVTQTANPATHAQTDMQVAGINGDSLELVAENGNLGANTFFSNVQSTIAVIPYDAVADRWWQIREARGIVYFETSPDGVTFTSFASLTTPAFAPLVNIVLESGTFESETSGGASHFDNLNGGTASGAWCPASSLHDDFNSGVIGDEWGGSYVTGGCSYAEAGGNVSFTLVSTGTQDCALVSAAGFDLTGDSVFAALATTPNRAGQTYAYLRASTPNGDDVEVTQIGGNLVCAQTIAGNFSSTCSIPFDPVNHQFFRFTESGGNLSWETSADGAAWTTQSTTPSPIPLTAVNFAVGAGTNNAVASPGTAVFSTFDQLPP